MFMNFFLILDGVIKIHGFFRFSTIFGDKIKMK